MLVSAHEMYPERLIAFYGIDPQREGSAEKFEAAVKGGGVSGIKLHPTTGYYPNDRSCYALYEICVCERAAGAVPLGAGVSSIAVWKVGAPAGV